MGVARQGGGVSEDATLDAFAESESESTAEATSSDDADESTGAAEGIPVTSSWAETASCPDCGDEVTRLWQDEEVSVCAACKTWRAPSESACDR
jgi:hypothetical protein